MGGSLARKIGRFPPRGAFSWTSLCCMNFQYPEFDRWCDQRPVAFWQRRVRRSPGSTSASSRLPGIRYGLGKRRYREIARCGPRDDYGEHPGWGKRERRQQADVSFHLALVLRDLGERLNAARYEIVDPSPCFDDRQQDGVACLRFQHRLAARLMQNPFHGNEGRRIPRHGDDRRRRDCGILVTITRGRRCRRPICLGCFDGTWFSQVDFDRFWTDDDAFDEPGDRLAIGDVAVTFGRRIFP